MKHLDEFRDQSKVMQLVREIDRLVTRSWKIMEVCGGQTHSILRHGIDQLLPRQVELIHGPGCPVCVTPIETIDTALAIASLPNVIFCSFGDMLRVPGSSEDLFRVKGAGGDVRVVYSPLDALKLARSNRDKQVVFLAIGFETTAPANAMAVKLAKRECLTNFSILVAHVLVPPAIEAIMKSDDCCVQAFLAAGHVCAVTGYTDYQRLCDNYHVPIVVTGFEPLDLLEGVRRSVLQLEQGRAGLENAYDRVVKEEGNLIAQNVIDEVFEVTDRSWRGLGLIPESGWKLKSTYADFDAALKFSSVSVHTIEASRCRAGEVLLGTLKPYDCPAFGKECTPRNPLGATMVSSEGACAAHYHYGSHPSSHRSLKKGIVDP